MSSRAALHLTAVMVMTVGAASGNAQEPAIDRPDGSIAFDENCGICHAPGELGTMVLSRRLGPERAVLTGRDDLPPAYIRHVVRHGLGGMPPFTRGDVADDELDAIIGYLTHSDQ